MRVGLEKEFFVVDEDGNPQVMVDDLIVLPYDECGWLAEARGKPYTNIVDAEVIQVVSQIIPKLST